MSATFVIDGLPELLEALRQLPEELVGEATHIVQEETNAAVTEIKSAYPRWTGNLRDHLSHELMGDRFGAVGVIKNTAHHAWLFENGSEARHYVTKGGARHATGTMPEAEAPRASGKTPPGHVFTRVLPQRRRVMYTRLRDLLERHDLLVTADE